MASRTGKVFSLPLAFGLRHLLLALVLFLYGTSSLRAALQFDVFLGYDNSVSEGNWFPVTFEIRNDGPTFKGKIEITPGGFGANQTRETTVELPTGTLKRVSVPVFASSRHSRWTVRLLDEKGRLKAEHVNVQPKKTALGEIPMMAALAKSLAGMPLFPPIKPRNQEWYQPTVARYTPAQAAFFPDNAIALEGLNVVYLNSELLAELKQPQVEALDLWVQHGGQLIVAIELVADINASPFLKSLMPGEIKETRRVQAGGFIHDWVSSGTYPPERSGGRAAAYQSLAPDPAFRTAEFEVFDLQRGRGKVLAQANGQPLMVENMHGRGRVTLLLFNPEKAPFNSWTHRTFFWAKLAQVPPRLLETSDITTKSPWSLDGLFSSMIESRQVRRLPLGWLVLLLIGYLLVIGPVDYLVLKRMNRQMLTWITFPIYVVSFSALIYLIGFKLRAGDSELATLNIMDVLSEKGEGLVRRRSFLSIYSPANTTYPVEGQTIFSTLRGEFSSTWGGGQESSQLQVRQEGNNFRGEVQVPVWTSQLFIGDSYEKGESPLVVDWSSAGGEQGTVRVQNRTRVAVEKVFFVHQGRVHDLGNFGAGETRNVDLAKVSGVFLQNFVRDTGGQFFFSAQQRLQHFSNRQVDWTPQMAPALVAASFIPLIPGDSQHQQFIAPKGFDLLHYAETGHPVVFAWVPAWKGNADLHRFTPRRQREYTLFRHVLPQASSPAAGKSL